MKITIEAEALDSLKAMAQQLQSERDELLRVSLMASAHLHRARLNARTDVEEMSYKRAVDEIDAIIDKCTSKPEVLA